MTAVGAGLPASSGIPLALVICIASGVIFLTGCVMLLRRQR
jgi:hypothetical protein